MFKIKPDKRESINKTIRFPLELIERIENVIKEHDVTFSGFIIQACEYALDHMDSDDKENNRSLINDKENIKNS